MRDVRRLKFSSFSTNIVLVVITKAPGKSYFNFNPSIHWTYTNITSCLLLAFWSHTYYSIELVTRRFSYSNGDIISRFWHTYTHEEERERKKLLLNLAREKVENTRNHLRHVCVCIFENLLCTNQIQCTHSTTYSLTHSFIQSLQNWEFNENVMSLSPWAMAKSSKYRKEWISKDRETNECVCVR